MVPTDTIGTAQLALTTALEAGPEQPITPAKLHAFLDGLQLSLGEVSEAIATTYFGKTEDSLAA